MSSLRLAFELFCVCDVLWNTATVRNAMRDDPQFQRYQATLLPKFDHVILAKASELGELSAPHPFSVVVQAAIDCLRGDLAGDERAARAAALLIGIHDHLEKTCGGPCDGCRSGPQAANLFREWAWSGLDEPSMEDTSRKLRELDREA